MRAAMNTLDPGGRLAMRSVQRVLASSMCVGHLVLGVSVLFRYGPPGQSAAWSVLAEFWTYYGSPIMFLVISVFAAVGFFRRSWLQYTFYLASAVVWIWAAALAIAWCVGFGPQPGCFWLANVAVLKWSVAHFWLAFEEQVSVNVHQTAAIDRLSHEVARTVHESRRGRHAGDSGKA